MRPTSIVQSGMPTGKKYMGWWGSMGGPRQKGITSYTISATQTAALRGAFAQYAFFGYKRIMQQAPYFVLPLGAAYALIQWAKEKNHYYNSKAGHLALGEHED